MTEEIMINESAETQEPLNEEHVDSSSNDITPEEAPKGESIDVLKEDIRTLKEQIAELEAAKQAQERMLEEISDFHALFPEADLEAIPEEVWASVKNGQPLAAAYALYQRRAEAEMARIAKINAKNASRSAGIAGKNTAGEYFTPDEVRKMSRAEVHANYSKIKESMKKWM